MTLETGYKDFMRWLRVTQDGSIGLGVWLPVLAVLYVLVTVTSTPAFAGRTKEVRAGNDTTFNRATIEVTYDDPLWFGSHTSTLTHGECSWMGHFLIRVCARLAEPIPEKFPNDAGYDPNNPDNNRGRENFGNRTGLEGDPRIQLCAYEDPCDGMDPPDGICLLWENNISPFHKHTPNQDAISMSNAILIGGAAAVVAGPFGIVAGMFTGAMVSLITSHFNHVVIETLGCVDVPMPPMPPEWCNDCWYVPYYPTPEIESAPDATFFDPAVKITICQNSESLRDPKELEKCSHEDAVVLESFELHPNLSNMTMRDGRPLYRECKVPSAPNDSRNFCAEVSTARPWETCVFREMSDGDRAMLACVDRPPEGQGIPKPTISQERDTFDGARVTIQYPDPGEGILQLREDPALFDGKEETVPNPDWTEHCGYLQQYEFCLFRPCEGDDGTSGPGSQCDNYEDYLCVSGYSPPYGVAINVNTGDVIEGTPNKENPVINAGEAEWIYQPPFCWERDPVTLDCKNYTGECCSMAPDPEDPSAIVDTCPGIVGPYTDEEGMCLHYVPHVGVDVYTLDTDPIDPACPTTTGETEPLDCRPKETVRPLTPKEMGMCLRVPDSNFLTIENGPTTFDYNVPNACGRVQVRMWAGGGRGHASGGGDSNDFSGGSGSYAQLELDVDPLDTIEFVVGGGSVGGGNWHGYPSCLAIADDPPVALNCNDVDAITVNPGKGHNVSVPVDSYGIGNAGVLPEGYDSGAWRWKGEDCQTGNSNAGCYIMDQTRHGYSGGHSGNGIHGPAGGNTPPWWWYINRALSVGPAGVNYHSRFSEGYIGCWPDGVRPHPRSIYTELPDEPLRPGGAQPQYTVNVSSYGTVGDFDAVTVTPMAETIYFGKINISGQDEFFIRSYNVDGELEAIPRMSSVTQSDGGEGFEMPESSGADPYIKLSDLKPSQELALARKHSVYNELAAKLDNWIADPSIAGLTEDIIQDTQIIAGGPLVGGLSVAAYANLSEFDAVEAVADTLFYAKIGGDYYLRSYDNSSPPELLPIPDTAGSAAMHVALTSLDPITDPAEEAEATENEAEANELVSAYDELIENLGQWLSGSIGTSQSNLILNGSRIVTGLSLYKAEGATVFEHRWPGAGGCSWDDPDDEPWGHGAHGRVEIKCIKGSGLIMDQVPCPATTQVVGYLNIETNTFEMETCTMPETPYGFYAPAGSCENTASTPAIFDASLGHRVRAFRAPPMCNNGSWVY